jgi:hypothetical protein
VEPAAPPPDPPCARCRVPLGQAPPRTCALCGWLYHAHCAGPDDAFARASCPHADPAHPAWTKEARAASVWLYLTPPPPGPWLRRGMLLCTLALLAAQGGDHLQDVLRTLQSGAGGLPRWALLTGVLSVLLVPLGALFALALVEHTTRRSALLDEHGALFDHSSRWRGARLSWARMRAFRLVDGGVRLVVMGRPWTTMLGPTLPCEGRLQHEVVVLLERHGVQRLDD